MGQQTCSSMAKERHSTYALPFQMPEVLEQEPDAVEHRSVNSSSQYRPTRGQTWASASA